MLTVKLQRQLRDFTLDVDFAAPTQGALALIGPTGCGKTMTLRLVAGLEPPDAGAVIAGDAVLYDSETGVDLPPHERNIGLVFQDYALFPHMTVLGNVTYGLRAHGVNRRHARDTAREALETLKIGSLAAEPVQHLSGGQRQRVALARALAIHPRLLLLDEPLSALDAQVRNHVRSELRDFIQTTGICTIIVTHDHVDALTLAEKVCVMHEGRIIQGGTRRELLARPASQFVADFLGLNLFKGEARRTENGGVEVHCQEGRFYTLEEVSGPVFLTCHPHDVTVSLSAPVNSALNVSHGRVAGLVHLGPTVRVTVAVNSGTVVAEISARSTEEMALEMGQEVYTHFKASAARCYE